MGESTLEEMAVMMSHIKDKENECFNLRMKGESMAVLIKELQAAVARWERAARALQRECEDHRQQVSDLHRERRDMLEEIRLLRLAVEGRGAPGEKARP